MIQCWHVFQKKDKSKQIALFYSIGDLEESDVSSELGSDVADWEEVPRTDWTPKMWASVMSSELENSNQHDLVELPDYLCKVFDEAKLSKKQIQYIFIKIMTYLYMNDIVN